MPTYIRHREQAEHNKALLTFFVRQNAEERFSDWYVTVAFYAALHCFEAMLFARKPVVPAGGAAVEHSGDLRDAYGTYSEHRLRSLVMCSDFQQIYTPYSLLYRMSRTARYNCHTPSKHDWKRAERLLDEVKTKCEALAGNKK
jgi:hypothetical protein